MRAGVGWKKEIVVDQSTVDTGTNSQAGYTLLSQEPVVVTDLENDKRFTGPPLLKDHGVVSGMSCIIWGKNKQPYGVLGVHSTKKRHFSNNDISFLQYVANVLAAAILRKQVEESLKDLEQRQRKNARRWRKGRAGEGRARGMSAMTRTPFRRAGRPPASAAPGCRRWRT